MNKLLTVFFILALSVFTAYAQMDEATEKKINDMVRNMTLEEKIGQMTQLTLDMLGKGDDNYSSYLPFEFDEQMLDSVFSYYKVGSILNTASLVPLPVQEWQRIIHEIQKRSLRATGIPVVYGIDAVHGATYTHNSTLMPQNITLGATFNRDVVYEYAKVSAYETKASNIPWNFSPVLDMGRDPRWPRQWETFGEDMYLTSEMGAQVIRGFQGEDKNKIGDQHVAACLKHYVGYGASFSGKDRTPTIMADRELIEKHLYPFAKAIKSGALSVMVNSGQLNGLPVHASKTLLTEWLKEGLNWDGVIVTDWGDINHMWHRDKTTHSQKEAVCKTINAGVDIAMVPSETSFCRQLKELVEEEKVSEERINDAVTRILRLKFRLNLFEKPFWSHTEYPQFAGEEFRKISYNAAAEAITLLKNENDLLPIKSDSKVLVAGPNANSMRVLNGGWTYSWQGEKTDQFLPDGTTILKAIQNKFGEKNVIYEPGITYNMDGKYWEENEPDYQSVIKAVKKADYIILCLGENSYCEIPGNLDDLHISENQQELARQLATTGKPIILVLNEGRPRIISKIQPFIPAIVQIYLPGSEGGNALADMLTGDVNPSGKLPYTYPKFPNSLITYDYKPSENAGRLPGAYDYETSSSWQWGFGYGLSYTQFEYSNLTIDKNVFSPEDIIRISVDIKNTGKRAGKESVLLFIGDQVATLTPDIRRLREFEKISLEPGETKTITFTVPAKHLAYVGIQDKWILEEGAFTVQVGNLFGEIYCNETKQWEGLYIE